MKNFSNPQLVIFDLDGTLIDSVPSIGAALNLALGETAGLQVPLAKVRNWVGNGSHTLVNRALINQDTSTTLVNALLLEQTHQRFLYHYAQHLNDPCPLYAGTTELLTWFHNKGTPQAIATNKPQQFVPALLKHQGIKKFFSAIVGGNSLPEKKPHPLPLLTLCEQFSCLPSNALMIGDSRSDADSAIHAGIPCWLVQQGYSQGIDLQQLGAQKVFKDTQELLGYVTSKTDC